MTKKIFETLNKLDTLAKESLCNDTTVKKWKDATVKEYCDPLEGDHIGINSEFFE